MLLRNLGVGSEQRCRHSRACVGAECGCAARLFLQSSGLLLAGAEPGDSNAASTQAARLKSTVRQHARTVVVGMAGARGWALGLRVWREK
jgi:hypothetical protein